MLWISQVSLGGEPERFEWRLVATILANGRILEESVLDTERADTAFLVNAGRRTAAIWDRVVEVGGQLRVLPVLQWLGPRLQPRSSMISLPPPLGVPREIKRMPGGFVQLVQGLDIAPPDSSEGVFLRFFDDAGREPRPAVLVNPSPEGRQFAWNGGLVSDLGAGVVTATYSQTLGGFENPEADVFYRRFSVDGDALTPAVRMNAHLPQAQGQPAVASLPNGGFVGVWVSQEQDGSHAGIFGRRFAGDGQPLGPEFQVNQVTFSDQLFPKIARDAAGNFVVLWESFDPSSFGVFGWDIKARLFRADGRPVGPEIPVNQYLFNDQRGPVVSFAPNGTFIVAWGTFSQFEDNFFDAVARRFSASPADEPCLVGGGKFRCDTGRTGGELEVEHSFGGAGSGLGFLGDLDGDGREDLCVYTGGTFRCDTDHEGGAAEVRIAFATTGNAVPLLGDMDGDGRADPCLAKPGSFSCDTRHNGGAAELKIKFGQPGETLLLGDLDGDRRAEACAFAGGLFRCDTGHNGGKAELVIRFGRRGDQALLGDFDGDGRDDPCVFRDGMLLCDTAHDGGAAEGTLSLGGPGDRVVLGNLDGL
jgi:hypothetical protein